MQCGMTWPTVGGALPYAEAPEQYEKEGSKLSTSKQAAWVCPFLSVFHCKYDVTNC